MNEKKDKILMLSRFNQMFLKLIKAIYKPTGAKIIFSMWEGYLNDEFKQYCSKNSLIIEQVHSSGNASVNDLKAFANAIKPKILIPIHTFSADQYNTIYKNTMVLNDGESLNIY